MKKSDFQKRVNHAKQVAKDSIKDSVKNKKIRKFDKSQLVTFILMVFWTISSILGVFGFVNSFQCKDSQIQVIGASAYEGTPDKPVPTVFRYSPRGLQGLSFSNATTSISTRYQRVLTKLDFRLDIVNMLVDIYYYDADTLMYGDSSTAQPLSLSIDLNNDTGSSMPQIFPAMTASYYSNSSIFNPEIFNVSFFNYRQPDLVPVGAVLNSITYELVQEEYGTLLVNFNFYDGLDNYIWTMYFSCVSSTFNAYPYSPYFVFPLELGESYQELVYLYDFETYYNSYQEGYIEGLEENQDKVNRLEIEKQNAYQNGRTDGYQEGLNAQNPYTFGNLLTSVIDVPVKAFTSLLDFDFLGVNLLAFAESLLFIAVLLAVVKLLI